MDKLINSNKEISERRIMANFEQHVNGAVLGSGLLIVPLYSSGILSMGEAGTLLALGMLGGILPDLDSDNSKPVQIAFRILSLFLPLFFILGTAVNYTIVEFLLFWLGSSVGLYFIFHFVLLKLTTHRGIFHSIPMGILFAQFTILIGYHLFELELYFATLSGLFVFIGFVIHLLLDEFVSLNALGMSIKKSFGTALKLYDKKNMIGTFVVYLLIGIQIYFIPKEYEAYKQLFSIMENIRLY